LIVEVNMNAAEFDDTIATLEDADKALRKHLSGLKNLIHGVPCDGETLLELLHELADADQDCSDHFARYPDERGYHDSQSKPCRDDWSRCHQRREKAVRELTRFARALRAGESEAV
jgi:hypothetical protein